MDKKEQILKPIELQKIYGAYQEHLVGAFFLALSFLEIPSGSMRFFIELAYKGTNYVGWQIQKNGISVQECIEKGLSKILNQEISIVGCGRTDAGVHASEYFAHFDFENELPENTTNRLNHILAEDILIKRIFEVDKDAHARFDAVKRSYEYKIILQRDPFQRETAFFFPQENKLDKQLVQDAASLLLNYSAFFPFCKTHSDVKTMNCQMHESRWEIDLEKKEMIFHITANRFLRGMVRMVVGMCLNVGLGKLTIEEVITALEKQERLARPYSVPAEGLFLSAIEYPFLDR